MQPESFPAIDADAAAATDAVLLDVREHDEWRSGHAPAAVHIPMGELTARVAELEHSRRIICICRSGGRSARVTTWLRQQGLDAVNMTGGMNSWASLGLPVINDAGGPGVVI